MVVKMGEIEARRETLPVVVFCRAKFSVMKYREPEQMPQSMKVNSSLQLLERKFRKVKRRRRRYAAAKRETSISTGVKSPDGCIRTLVERKEVPQEVATIIAPMCAISIRYFCFIADAIRVSVSWNNKELGSLIRGQERIKKPYSDSILQNY